MKIVSLQLTKIYGERINELQNPEVNNNIQFTNLEKNDSLEIFKDHNIMKVNFSYSLIYSNNKDKDSKDAEILFDGFFLLSLSSSEQKEFEKSWKDKRIPETHIESLFNA